MDYDTVIQIGKRQVGPGRPVYFIADLASNHDGDIAIAKELIWAARAAGADAVKFQHFKADRIVSDHGFRTLGTQIAHQAGWKKSVYEVYEQYTYNRAWDEELIETAHAAGIDWMTTPYDFDAVTSVAPHVAAFKIGSGDITWLDLIEKIASEGKTVLLATGASDLADVRRAVGTLLRATRKVCLMQCNTNYTGSLENFHFINLRVLRSYAALYPGMVLGLSDHTPGHATVLGAVTLGACVVEKHFTIDNAREGPDHGFSMNPKSWQEMVARTRELEAALGDGIKRIEGNEKESAVVQRRCLRLSTSLPAGTIIGAGHLQALRPAPSGAFLPYQMDAVVGRRLLVDKPRGAELYAGDLGEPC